MESATAAVEALFQAAGCETARVRDDAGLVLSRILCLIVNEAASMLMEGAATARDIDTAMRLGTNYPHGPLEWADIWASTSCTRPSWGCGENRTRIATGPAHSCGRWSSLAGSAVTGCGFFEYPER